MAIRRTAPSAASPSSTAQSLRLLLLLAHPLILASAALLAANELVLSRLWPSWLTGKLGDFAWLAAAPALAAALLALLSSAAVRGADADRRAAVESRVFYAVLALCGLLFALAKTLPSINALAVRIFGYLLNARPSITLDPSDLIALPALLLPAALYYRLCHPAPARTEVSGAPVSFPRALVALLALPLVCLSLLADAPAPNMGFTCLQAADGKIYAAAGYTTYLSEDGGLTWTENQPGAPVSCSTTVREGEWTIANGPSPERSYRYQPGKEIQVSSDGGKSWQPGIALTTASEPEYYYMVKTHDGNPVYQPGPLDAAADPASGNMLFAMGYEGVLVHTADGRWVWSYGGPYRRAENFPDAAAFSVLLGGEIYMALVLALLVYASGALRHTMHWLRIVAAGLAWLAWLAVDLIFPPITSTSYAVMITLAGLAAAALLALPLVIEQTVRLSRRAPRAILPLALIALGAGLAFLLPYVLWIYGVLPNLNLATIGGLVVAAAFTAAAVLSAGRKG